MLSIEHRENSDDELGEIIDIEFENYAAKYGLACKYKLFNFVAKENNKIVGILTGYSLYNEIHIKELVVVERYRNKHIGSELIKTAEDYYKDKDFEIMTLNTYNFQAPEFYKKLGFQIEYIRENKENSKLAKYFFIKYF